MSFLILLSTNRRAIAQCKLTVLEVSLIEQYQPIFEPWAGIEPVAVVGFLVGDAELIDGLVSDVVEQGGAY